MVILGKEQELGSPRLTAADAAGLALAFVSSLSLAAFMVLVQATEELLDDEALMWINYATQAALSGALALALEPQELPPVAGLTAWEWAQLAALSVVIQWGASFAQQVRLRLELS